MVQLKITPVAEVPDLPSATPEAFGAGIGPALASVAEGINTIGVSLQAVGDARARDAANKFDKELALREANIVARPGNAETFESDLLAARDELTEKFSDTPFINQQIFQRQTRQRAGERQINIRGKANALILQAGLVSLNENLIASSERLASTNDRALQALELADIASQVNAAAGSGLISAESIPKLIREASVDGVIAAHARLLNSNPMEALQLVNDPAFSFLPTKAKAQLSSQAIEKYQSDLSTGRSQESASRRASAAALTTKQDANVLNIMTDQLNGNPLTPEDLKALVAADPTAFSTDQLSVLRTDAASGGSGISPSAINAESFSQAIDWADGTTAIPERFPNLKSALTDLALHGQIPVDKITTLLERSTNRRFGTIRRTIKEAISRLVIIRPAGALEVQEALADFDKWTLDNPNVTAEEAQIEMRTLVARRDRFGLLNIIPSERPEWMMINADTLRVDIEQSGKQLSDRIHRSRDGRLPKGQPGHLTEEAALSAGAELEEEMLRQTTMTKLGDN